MGVVREPETMSLPRGSHANTFGGNPVAAAAALATLEVIEEEDLLRHAESLGEELKKVFREELGEGYDVRGLGLMIGVEMLKKSDLEGVLTRAFKRGVAVIGAGFSTIRIAPPLVIPREMALKAASIIIDVVKS